MAPIPLVQAVTFAAAEKRIWITNAYCTPTDDQVELLVRAVERGVDVRLILPGRKRRSAPDENRRAAPPMELLEGGVKIFEYQPTMIHSKSMAIDGRLFHVRLLEFRRALLGD